MRCSECGTENPSGARYCAVCGRMLSYEETRRIWSEEDERTADLHDYGDDIYNVYDGTANPIRRGTAEEPPRRGGGIWMTILAVLLVVFGISVTILYILPGRMDLGGNGSGQAQEEAGPEQEIAEPAPEPEPGE